MTYLKKKNINKAIRQNWGRNMYMKPTCTRYKISLWVGPINNCRIRRHWIPPSSRLNWAETLSDTWWYSRSSASRINLNIIPSGIYAWLSFNYTTPSRMQTKIWPINWSCFLMHRRLTRHTMEALCQKESNIMGWIYCTHYMPLVLSHFWNNENKYE